MTGEPESEPSSRTYVRALERGLVTIKALGDYPDGASLSDIASQIGLDRATTRRFLLTLCHLGYVRQVKRRFYLAPRVLELGLSYFAAVPVWEAAQPFLDSYCEETRGTISIGVLDDTEVVYVARAQSKRSVYAINVTVGSRFPCYSTSLGRVLLAWRTPEEIADIFARIEIKARTPNTLTTPADIEAALATVRQRDYAISNEETELGIRSIAIPLRNRHGMVVAALNTSFQVSYATAVDLTETYLPALRDVAGKIEALNLLPGKPDM